MVDIVATTFTCMVYYSVPDGGAEYCDERVCLSVCVSLSTIISTVLHAPSSPNFLRMSPFAVARSSSVIRYVFPVFLDDIICT